MVGGQYHALQIMSCSCQRKGLYAELCQGDSALGIRGGRSGRCMAGTALLRVSGPELAFHDVHSVKAR